MYHKSFALHIVLLDTTGYVSKIGPLFNLKHRGKRNFFGSLTIESLHSSGALQHALRARGLVVSEFSTSWRQAPQVQSSIAGPRLLNDLFMLRSEGG